MSSTEKIILPEDVVLESATINFPGSNPITLYKVPGDGKNLYSSEESARYRMCTHAKCTTCGTPAKRPYTLCESCRHKRSVQRYRELPFEEWDGKTMLCIYGDDQYFQDHDDIVMYCDDHDIDDSTQLMLVICTPNYIKPIQHDWFEDDLPEDGELPKELNDKIEEFNKFIETLKPISWSEGKVRTTVNVNEDLNKEY